MLKRLLAHPLTVGLELDDPRTTELRRRLVREKPFLRQIYLEWYRSLLAALPDGGEPVLEIGSGAGFFGEVLPAAILSEVFPVSGVSTVLDAHALPVATGSLRGIVMTDVLHHLRAPARFLTEAARCVRGGGVVAMVEPWVTPWSRFVWGRLHHEPFEPDTPDWTIPAAGPLTGANGALPWILFERDAERFERTLPTWRVESIQLGMPFRYLLSGGVSLRSLAPGWSFGLWRWIEERMDPWSATWGTFATVVLRRTEVPWHPVAEEAA